MPQNLVHQKIVTLVIICPSVLTKHRLEESEIIKNFISETIVGDPSYSSCLLGNFTVDYN